MARLFVGVTDKAWFDQLRRLGARSRGQKSCMKEIRSRFRHSRRVRRISSRFGASWRWLTGALDASIARHGPCRTKKGGIAAALFRI